MKRVLLFFGLLSSLVFQHLFAQCTQAPQGTPKVTFDCDYLSDSALVTIDGVTGADYYEFIYVAKKTEENDTIISLKDSIYIQKNQYQADGHIIISSYNTCGKGQNFSNKYSYLHPFQNLSDLNNTCISDGIKISNQEPYNSSFLILTINGVFKEKFTYQSLDDFENDFYTKKIKSDLFQENDIVKIEYFNYEAHCALQTPIFLLEDTIHLLQDSYPKIKIKGNQSITHVGKETELVFHQEVSNGVKGEYDVIWTSQGTTDKYMSRYNRDSLVYNITEDTKFKAIVFPTCGVSDTAFFNFTVIDKNIEGKLFHDKNGNCKKDSSESFLNYLQVKSGNETTITDENGWYYLSKPVGSHTIYFVPKIGNIKIKMTSTCEQKVSLKSSLDTIANVNIGITIDSTHYVDVYASSSRMRPGFDGTYHLNISNKGFYTEKGEVFFVIDKRLENVSSRPQASRQSGDTLFFAFQEINSTHYYDNIAVIDFKVPADVELLGKKMISYVGLNVVKNESEEQVKKIETIVTGSYDPNDKQVNHTQISPTDYRLDYKIRFQNTGTDTAFTVVIRDTISSLYDLSTLDVGATSHDYTFKIEPNNVLTWIFNDILLPDSTTNEAKSHGFVTFSIHRKKDLVLDTKITNKAEIYFDYNPPIITNTASTLISQNVAIVAFTESKELLVYPNPSSGTIQVECLSKGKLQLVNSLGIVVLEKNIQEGSNLIDCQELGKGMYVVILNTEKGIEQSKLIIE